MERSIQPAPNSVVLDHGILNSAVRCSDPEEEGPFLFNFLNLSVLLESLVLHDYIRIYWPEELYWAVGARAKKSMSSESFANDPVVAPFLEKGVMELQVFGEKDYVTVTYPYFEEVLESGDQADAVATSSGIFQFLKSREHNLAYTPDLTSASDSVVNYASAKTDLTQGILVDSYGQLSDHLLLQIERLAGAGNPKTIFIPPITAIILDQARSYDDIGLIALELRSELQPYREQFLRYVQTIQDDSASIEESLTALDRLEEAMRLLTEPKRNFDLRSVSEWKDIGTLAKAGLDGITMDDPATLMQFLIGKPAKELARYLRRREVMYFGVLKKKFMDLKQYGNLFESKFGVQLSRKHIRKTHSRLSPRYRRLLLAMERRLFN